ncbi:hypothetical protein PENTCL1PPCAC_23372, partial [Pristionchus entomophagus]
AFSLSWRTVSDRLDDVYESSCDSNAVLSFGSCCVWRACSTSFENRISSARQRTCDGYLLESMLASLTASSTSLLRVSCISSDNCCSQTSTCGTILIGFERLTVSPWAETIAVIEVASGEKSTRILTWKSFLRCCWITAGFVLWPRISRRSSSPMK